MWILFKPWSVTSRSQLVNSINYDPDRMTIRETSSSTDACWKGLEPLRLFSVSKETERKRMRTGNKQACRVGRSQLNAKRSRGETLSLPWREKMEDGEFKTISKYFKDSSEANGNCGCWTNALLRTLRVGGRLRRMPCRRYNKCVCLFGLSACPNRIFLSMS